MSVSQIPARRLRIAVFNRTFAPTGGGAERYAIALVEQLAARHEIHVYAQQIAHQWPDVNYHRVSMPLRKPRWVNQLWFASQTWWATRRGFDIVHSHENTWHGNVQTVHVLPVWHTLFKGRHGLRLALRWLGVLTSPRLLTYLGLESSRFRLSGAAKSIVVTSDSLRQTMADTFPAAEPALAVLVPGVSLPPLPVTPDQKAQARRDLGLPQHGTGILLVANDMKKKGLIALLQANSLLSKSKREGVFLILVGSRAQQPQFQAQAEALGLGDKLFFLGPLDDVGIAYRAADILAHPTWEDTFAMVVLEAMAHGLPVVVSGARWCGIAGLLRDGENALLMDDPHDANALAQALAQLLDDPARAAALGAQARLFAEQHAWPEKARQQERIYFSLLSA